MGTAHQKEKYGKRIKVPKYLDLLIKNKQPVSAIDFGCGKGKLRETFRKLFPSVQYIGLDPCVPEFDIKLTQVDLIFSTDVLEHVEPEYIIETLKEIRQHCKYTYHLISCAPAKLVLPDGRNAHLIQEGPDWWTKKFIDAGFTIKQTEWTERTKYSKQLKKEIPIKEFIVIAE